MDAKYGGYSRAQSDIWPRDPATQSKKDDRCQCFELGYVWAVGQMGELGSHGHVVEDVPPLLVLVARICGVEMNWQAVACEEGTWSSAE